VIELSISGTWHTLGGWVSSALRQASQLGCAEDNLRGVADEGTDDGGTIHDAYQRRVQPSTHGIIQMNYTEAGPDQKKVWAGLAGHIVLIFHIRLRPKHKQDMQRTKTCSIQMPQLPAIVAKTDNAIYRDDIA